MDSTEISPPPDSTLDKNFQSEVLPLLADLFAHAMKYTRNRSDADDLVQDTLTRAIKAWNRYESGTNCKAWLFRILNNRFVDGYRRRQRHIGWQDDCKPVVGSVVSGPWAIDVPARSRGVSPLISGHVISALASLGEEFRVVVEMADILGHEYKEISTRLNLPIGTVMSRLFRARQRLRLVLADYAASVYGIHKTTV